MVVQCNVCCAVACVHFVEGIVVIALLFTYINQNVERMCVCPLRHQIYKKMRFSQEMHLVTTSALEDREPKIYVLLVALLFLNSRQVRQ